MNLGDEVLKHLLGDQEIGDHSVLQRSNCGDVSGRSTQHPFGIEAHGGDRFLIALRAQRHHGWFVQNDATIPDVYQGVRRA